MPKLKRTLLATSIAVAMMAPIAVQAQSIVWTGSQSSDWFDAGNWTSETVPTVPSAADDVVIDTDANTSVISGVGEAFAQDVVVGNQANGELTIANDSSLSNRFGVIGAQAGSQGAVSVDGAVGIATWANDGRLTIGAEGAGRLDVRNNGVVTSAAGVIGESAGSTGTVTVDNGSWTNVADLFVGGAGHGELLVQNGGQVSNRSASIASEAGSTGAAVVRGATWTNAGQLIVGGQGSGTLDIAEAGQVSSESASIGDQAGGNGTVTLIGAGSSWQDTGAMIVGGSGTGRVGVLGGATLNTGGTTTIGRNNNGLTSEVVVDNAVWNSGDTLRVGGDGNGKLTIRNGGVVNSATQGFVFTAIAGSSVGSKGEISIEGPGSAWLSEDRLMIGGSGEGALTIRSGGATTVGSLNIASLAGSIGTVVVDGTDGGADLNVDDFLTVGENGAGALIVRNGGHLNSAITGIASGDSDQAATSTGAVTVQGAGSVWTNTLGFSVGSLGAGALNILDGATVDSQSGATVGDNAGASGAVNVEGQNSLWAINGDLTVGDAGIGSLEISDGGTVDVDDARTSTIGNVAGSHGVAIVNTNAKWDAGITFTVGQEGNGELHVDSGGKISAGLSVLGSVAGATGTATVAGSGSSWIADDFKVGRGGAGTLNILNGGQVQSLTDVNVAEGSGSGAVTVDGVGSSLTVDSFLSVGNEGSGALFVLNGGKVNSNLSGIGGIGGSQGVALIDGQGSEWNNVINLVVGDGSVGSLTISNGGKVTSLFGDLGIRSQGIGTVTVKGPEAQLSISDQLLIAFEGTGELNIQNGASAIAESSTVIADAAGSKGTLNIGSSVGQAAVGAGFIDTPKIAFGSGTGTINFNHTDTGYAFDAAINGAGTVNVLSGTTALTAENTYTGATNVSGGKLLIEGSLDGSAVNVTGGALGGHGSITGDVNIADGGTLAPGGAVPAGNVGTLTINGNLSLSQGSHLDYDLGQAGVVGGTANDLVDLSGNLVLDGSLNVTDIGGFGPGVYRLMNYSGVLTDNGMDIGTRPAGVAAADMFVQTAFANQVNLISSAGATLEFWDGGDAAVHDNSAIEGGAGNWNATDRNWTQADGAINGPAKSAFTIFGGTAGAVTVEGEQAFTGAQFASDGYQLIAGADGALRNDAAETILRVDPTLTATVAVPIRGATRLVKTDAGTLVLNGASAYTGGVRVAGGRLVGDSSNLLGDIANEATLEFAQAADGIQAGAISGSGQLIKSGAGKLTLSGAQSYTGNTAIDAGTLALSNNQDRAYAGLFSGAGIFEKAGSGRLTLTGDSSAFAGSTVVQSGELRMDGALGGATSIATGARLSGNGRLQNLSVSGTIAPGASIGTLTVSGSYVQTAGSTYEAEIDTAGHSDRIAVNGAAQLAGAVTVLGQSALNASYTLLTANGGITGQYDALNNATFTPFLDFVLRYDPNAVFLDVARSATTFASIGATRNQIATGAALDRLSASSPLLGEAVKLDLPTAIGALDQLSGEIHASTRGALVEDSRFVREAADQRLRAAQGDSDNAAWAQAYGNGGSIDDDDNAAETDTGSGGVLVGADKAFGPARLGVMGGAGRISVQVDERHAKANSDSLYFGVYGGTNWGAWGLRAGALYGRHDVETERKATFGSLNESLRANYDARAVQGFVEAAYRIDTDKSSFEPYLNLAQVSVRNDGYQESGGAAALRGEREDTDTGLATLGLRASTQFKWGAMPASLHGGLGWRHAFGDELPLSHHAFVGGDTFVIAGAAIAEDVAVASARLDLQLSERANLELGYSGQVGEHSRENSVQAQLQVKF